jgi:hypothetical protein
VTRLRAHADAGVIRSTLDVQDEPRRALLADLGFEADLMTMSLYPGQ